MNPLTKKQKNKRWATVAVMLGGRNHISVLMKKGETKKEVEARVENSIWGPPAKVVGIYSKPWGK